MASQTQEIPGGEVLLRFEGSFEAADASKVHEALGTTGSGWAVVLDFSQVRHFEDFAIALLAPDLMASGHSRVRLRGLGAHQQRILQYLGVARATLVSRMDGGRRTADGPEIQA